MNESDFACPICLNLLYKPAVNTVCGHAFCFYCLFRAMSPYEASHCPLCRHAFGHLPGVCAALDAALRLSFPSSYAARAVEEEGQASGQGYSIHGVEHAAHPARLPDSLRCCHPGCQAVLALPRVLACGHALCAAHAAPEGSRAAWGCPLCAVPTPLPVARCGVLDRAVAALCPQLHAAAAAAERAQCGPHDTTTATQASVPPAQGRSATPTAGPPGTAQAGARAGAEGQGPATQAPLAGARTAEAFVHYGAGCDACGQHPIVGRRWRCRDCPAAIGFDLCARCHASCGAGVAVLGRFNQSHEPGHTMEEVRPRSTWLHLLQGLNPDLSPGQLLGMLALAQGEEPEEATEDGTAGEGEGADRAVERGEDNRGESGWEDGETRGEGGDSPVGSGRVGGQAERGQGGGRAERGGEPDAGSPSGSESREQAGAADDDQAGDGMGPNFMPSRRGPRPAQAAAAAWPSPSAPSSRPDEAC
ncbi:CGL103 [Auxenochlorella protothecoides x Auxenochlorella symbiontica]|uniref:E3 ubiquitin-protein ligase PRT1 n=2 Tax=Auxenochlorella protothecoides TaxID=3075 RepID=A0A3M7L311_AUXPR|nr:hypothetical protein APUTEX25_004346 [Auxenochlorella protothecoides]|eukprot:RMZ55922.1 hypothetical protein APUTEX25_004346 [Auxenochlorella protothecoides]